MRRHRLVQAVGQILQRLVQRFGSSGDRSDVEEEAHVGCATLRLFVQVGVVDGNRNLRRQRRQRPDVLVGEGVGLVGLYVQRADDPVLDHERQRHLRARQWQIGIGLVDDVGVGGIQRDLWHAAFRHHADHTVRASFQPVFDFEQLAARFAGTGAQLGEVCFFVHEENLDVVVAERVLNEVNEFGQ